MRSHTDERILCERKLEQGETHLIEKDLQSAVSVPEVAGHSHDDGRLPLERAGDACVGGGRLRLELDRVSAVGEVREPELFDRLDGKVLEKHRTKEDEQEVLAEARGAWKSYLNSLILVINPLDQPNRDHRLE